MPLGGYRGFPKRKVSERCSAHTRIAVAGLPIAEIELPPLQADQADGLLFRNDAICMIDPM
jgi:hypothetical protein